MVNPDLAIVRQAWEACSWGNTAETAEDWLATLRSGNDVDKQKLFKRIFIESPDTVPIRELFDKETIRTCLRTFDRPFKRSYSERRRKVWRYLYCDIREPIPGLDWVIGK
jgi:hypothetical protein